MFKILSWNIRQGGGSRVIPICKSVAKLNPTVAIFSEFRNNKSGIKIRTLLLQVGFRYQFVTHAASDANSVLIASKMPCTNSLYFNSDKEFSSNIQSIHFEAFNVMGVYLPHKKKHQLLPFITDLVCESESPYIIAGDFNTGINYIDQKGNSFWYTDQLEELYKARYLDAFRHIHGEVKEYSWYSHQGNGYRYDHTYVHNSILPIIKGCYYLHSWREAKMSDHSPMVLELGA